jgi:hypothetical protein
MNRKMSYIFGYVLMVCAFIYGFMPEDIITKKMIFGSVLFIGAMILLKD